MARQWKEIELTRHQGGSGSWVEEFARVVFMLWAALVILFLFAAIIFFCADGVSKESTKASNTTTNYANGSACAAAACGAGCGGGCGG